MDDTHLVTDFTHGASGQGEMQKDGFQRILYSPRSVTSHLVSRAGELINTRECEKLHLNEIVLLLLHNQTTTFHQAFKTVD